MVTLKPYPEDFIAEFERIIGKPVENWEMKSLRQQEKDDDIEPLLVSKRVGHRLI